MVARDRSPLGCGELLVVMIISGALSLLFYGGWEYGTPLVFALVVATVLGVTLAPTWTDRGGQHLSLLQMLLSDGGCSCHVVSKRAVGADVVARMEYCARGCGDRMGAV